MRGTKTEIHPASFRDPDGFIFQSRGKIYRLVNDSYRSNYELLMSSGLYENLTAAGLLISHAEHPRKKFRVGGANAWKVLEPAQIAMVSYPYEWCFSQFKAAALLTLALQKEALQCGMSLKDASAFNVQFHQGRPVFIDTLSFEKYHEGEPWVAYGQFCRHFAAPLLLMCCSDIRLNRLLTLYPDGVPLDLASRLLPAKTYLRFSVLAHIHMHARAQGAARAESLSGKKHHVGLTALLALLNNLESMIRGLKWRPEKTDWAAYATKNNYSPAAMAHKKAIVSDFLDRIKPSGVWDLGANTGIFSRIAAKRGIPTIAFDSDPGAVEKNYLECAAEGDTNLLPLLMDLINPSPGVGWENRERQNLMGRAQAHTVFALALIHHLAIAHNLPLAHIAGFFSRLGRYLVIEFVPKDDSQVQRLLMTRKDIFAEYDRGNFERAFGTFFTIEKRVALQESPRILYLMRTRASR